MFQIGVLLKKLRHEILQNSENTDSGNNITLLLQQKNKKTAENGLNTVSVIKNTKTNLQKRKNSLRLRNTFKPA